MKPISKQSDYLVTCNNQQEINMIMTALKGKTTTYTQDWKFAYKRGNNVGVGNVVYVGLSRLPKITFCDWLALPDTEVGTLDFPTAREAKSKTAKVKRLIVDPRFTDMFEALVKREFPHDVDAYAVFSPDAEIVKSVKALGFDNLFKELEAPRLPKLYLLPYVEGTVEKQENRVVFKYGNLILNRSWFLGNETVTPIEIKLSNGQTIGEGDVKKIRDYMKESYQYESSTIN